MGSTYHYKAMKIAEAIPLERYKEQHKVGLLSSSSLHLYYKLGDQRYVYLLAYGVVVYCNLNSDQMELIRKTIEAIAIHPHHAIHEDELFVNCRADQQFKIEFHQITLSRLSDESNKIIMLNLGQSVALDYYNGQSHEILGKIKSHTQKLNETGKVSLKEKHTLKFLGKTLKIKNEIAENLYILDTPDKTWEDEFIEQLNKKLSDHLELKLRYHSIENTMKIIEDNLNVFMSHNQHKESSRLEWIIIILIVIEVVDTFVAKLL